MLYFVTEVDGKELSHTQGKDMKAGETARTIRSG